MPTSGAVDQLKSSIPALLTYVSNQLSITGSLAYQKTAGVGVMEFRVLTTLALGQRLRASVIARSIGLDKSAVSRTLKSLQEAGLVVALRKPQMRRPDYSLSPEGHKVHSTARAIASKRLVLLLQGISDADRERLIELLRVMHDNVAHLKTMTRELKTVAVPDDAPKKTSKRTGDAKPTRAAGSQRSAVRKSTGRPTRRRASVAVTDAG